MEILVNYRVIKTSSNHLNYSLMKRIFSFIICYIAFYSIPLVGQVVDDATGLSLANYELPKLRTEFAPKSFEYYQPNQSEKSYLPNLTLNRQDLKRAKQFSIFANTLYLLSSLNNANNFGSIGRASPAFNPLINPANNANDYLLLQQHQFQRIGANPLFLAAPKALQLRF